MKKHFIRILIASLLLVITVFILVYKQPVKINKEFTAHYYGVESEYENETVSCILELEYKRYLFKTNEVHGSIFIDGKEYYSSAGYTKENGEKGSLLETKGFWEELKLKMSDPYYSRTIFNLAEYVENGKFTALQEDYLLFEYDSTLEYFCVILSPADEETIMTQFYGPAETNEEALFAMKKVYPE